jgi:hypothetical protein
MGKPETSHQSLRVRPSHSKSTPGCASLGTQSTDNRTDSMIHRREDAYRLQTPADHQSYYDAWAATYDADFALASGYRPPRAVAQAFLELAGPQDTPIADIGCGTGLLGISLGLPDVDGFDISSGMLAAAARTAAYRHLISQPTSPTRRCRSSASTAGSSAVEPSRAVTWDLHSCGRPCGWAEPTRYASLPSTPSTSPRPVSRHCSMSWSRAGPPAPSPTRRSSVTTIRRGPT